MKLTRLALIPAAVVVLAACGAPHSEYRSPSYSTPSYHATCTDSRGYVLADWRCDSTASGARWSYEPYSTWRRNSARKDYYAVGRKCTCGTTKVPNGGVQYANKKTVTVFKDGKQVGQPVKLGQDAKKASTITGESKRDSARTSSYGSYQPKQSTNRSSFGSSSRSSTSSRRK